MGPPSGINSGGAAAPASASDEDLAPYPHPSQKEMSVMPTLHLQLFGKFRARCDSEMVKGLDASKVQELLCYLLLHRDRPNTREMLAGVLWGDSSSTEKSKKYLRQALWHLQSALNGHGGLEGDIGLLVEHDWVQLNLKNPLRVDVAHFEQSCASVRGVPGRELDAEQAESLRAAVQLYAGDLLEGWYQDWCIYERERLQNLFLTALNKLMSYSLARRQFEKGLEYGAVILRYDRASERTHRQLMRLHYMSGDRTAALRQYERCVEALRAELGVLPEARTSALYERFRLDRAGGVAPEAGEEDGGTALEPGASSLLPRILNRLKRLQDTLGGAQRRVERDIRAIELDLKNLKH